MGARRFLLQRLFFVFAAWGGLLGILPVLSAFGQEAVHLYFLDPTQTHLAAESRQIAQSESPSRKVRTLLDALLAGPREGLVRAVPEGLSLRAAFVTGDRIAYVDFEKRPEAQLQMGAFSELLALYSIVNTLVLNLPEIEAVQILLDGREASTLAGHIDLTDPFKPNMLLIR